MAGKESNPWGSRGTVLGLQLGDPARILTLGRQHGVLPAGPQEMEESVEDSVPEFPSIKMIRILREISDLSNELYQLEAQVHRMLLDRETADLVHLDRLEVRLGAVDALLTHLTDVTTGKGDIQTQLQTKRVENSLRVVPSYQKYVHEVLTSLGDAVSTTGPKLSALEWGSQLQLSKSSLAKKLQHAEQSLAKCQAASQTSQKLHGVMIKQDTTLPQISS